MIFRSIVSGSSGNCTLFSDGDTTLLVDCGLSGKKLEASLCNINVELSELDGILVTHEHTDHTIGVGVVARKYGIPVYASSGTWENMEIGCIPAENIRKFDECRQFEIGSAVITPFDIPHDAAQPTGYIIESKGKRVAVATDMGCIMPSVEEALCGCEAVLLEANYDEHMLMTGSYPERLKKRIGGETGHLDNKDTGVLAGILAKNGTKQIMLGHLSNENNSPEIAFAEVARELEFGGITVGVDIDLSVAPRYEVSENFHI